MSFFYSEVFRTKSIKVSLLTLFCLACLSGALKAQNFTDVAAKKGVQYSYNDIIPGYGSGITFHDIDGDGWDDLTYPRTNDSIEVYLNDSGSFRRANLDLTNPQYPRQVLWFDYDNDGDKDLFVTQRNRKNILYEDTGNMQFVDVTHQAGLPRHANRSFGASVADYNKDGYLDIYVCNYDNSSPNIPSRYNKLYRNNGDGTFTNVAPSANVTEPLYASFQGIWIDVNDDNWPDLYVINDYSFRNSLFINQKNGGFREVSASANASLQDEHPMSASATDFDHDGDLDIYMSNSHQNTGNVTRDGMFLKRMNTGGLTYEDKAVRYGINIKKWSWGALWIDRNNNTYEDLFVATSNFGNQLFHNNVYWENQKADTFVRKPGIFSGRDTAKSFGVAKGDFNNDGFYDMVVQGARPGYSFLWENSGTDSNHYIKVTLEGTASNPQAVGSKVYTYVDTNTYYLYTQCGQNYMSQNSQHKIIGIGHHNQVDSLKIQYPSGHRDSFYNLNANQHYYFKEGETIESPFQGFDTLLCQGQTFSLDGGNFDRYQWNTGDTTQKLRVDSAGAYWVRTTTANKVTVTSDTVHVKQYPRIDKTVEQPSCYGNKDGRVKVTFDSLTKTASPSITWGNQQKGQTRQGLTDGTYRFTYQDQQGCKYRDSLTVSEPQPLALTPVVTQAQNRKDSAGQISVNPNGGTKPYTYLIDGQTANDPITRIPRDTYLLKLKDKNGCTASKQVPVTYNVLPGVNASVEHVSCYGSANGRIALRIDSLPNTRFSINWQDGATGLQRKGLSGGTYIYRYKDNKGASFLDTLQIKEPSPLQLKGTVTNATENQKGTLSLTPLGGQPPYQLTTDTGQVSRQLDNLSAGNYTIVLRDSSGCVVKKQFTIENTGRPIIKAKVRPISCAGAEDGLITLDIGKRQPSNYQVTWKKGYTGTIVRNLKAGTYTYQYQDTAGYQVQDSVIVDEPEPLQAHTKYAMNEVTGQCQQQLTIEHGTQPYALTIDGEPVNEPTQWLNAGKYQLSVTDSRRCTLDTNIALSVGSLSEYQLEKTQPSCDGQKDGKLQVQLPDGIRQQTRIQWEDGSNAFVREQLSAGQYSFQLTAPEGCQQSETIQLQDPEPLYLQTNIQHSPDHSAFNLRAVTKGGTPPYYYSLNNREVTLPLDTLKPGNHELKVTDSKGCYLRKAIHAGNVGVGGERNLDKESPVQLQPNLLPGGQPVSLTVQADEKIKNLRVLTAQGLEIWMIDQGTGSVAETEIKLPSLAPGTYFVKVDQQQSGTVYRKLIVME
jgi:hypothetical protein